MDDNNSLNIFQMIAKSIEPTKDLVKKELLVFFVLSSGCEGDQVSFSMDMEET
jgi:hypothetical protein